MERYIPVITKRYSCKVDVEDIIYIQQQQKKLAIVTDDEISWKIYSAILTIDFSE